MRRVGGILYLMRALGIAMLFCCAISAQVAITGRVVDENGTGVAGARVEFRADAGVVVASSDPAGNFRTNLPSAGTYSLRAERSGYFLYTNKAQNFESGVSQLTIR